MLSLLRAVADFKDVEQVRHAFDERVQAEEVCEVVEEMIQNVEDAGLAKLGNKLFAVRAQPLDLAMLSLIEAVDADVDFMVKLGKEGAYFLPDKEVGKIAEAVENFQAAVDGIVVGDRDQIHAAPLRRAIHVERLRIAVPRAEKAQMLCRARVPAMRVQISFVQLVRLPLNHDTDILEIHLERSKTNSFFRRPRKLTA